MVNEYLASLTFEQGQELYSFFGNLRLPVSLLVFWLHSRKYQLEIKQKIFLLILMEAAISWSGIFNPILNRLSNGIIPPANMGVAFLYFLVILAAGAYMLRIPILLTWEALIPAYVAGRGIAILGCVFYGCCHGFPSALGIYSQIAECITFPTVILDTLMSCLISAYIIWQGRKTNYLADGNLAGKSLILFGGLRLLVDILRDNQKLFLMITAEGICGLIYLVVGALILKKCIIHAQTQSI